MSTIKNWNNDVSPFFLYYYKNVVYLVNNDSPTMMFV